MELGEHMYIILMLNTLEIKLNTLEINRRSIHVRFTQMFGVLCVEM
jgi:hypothetical protein